MKAFLFLILFLLSVTAGEEESTSFLMLVVSNSLRLLRGRIKICVWIRGKEIRSVTKSLSYGPGALISCPAFLFAPQRARLQASVSLLAQWNRSQSVL
jgi:hypothetical protein